MKYIVLLRGINVGGNNKVPMSELKLLFESIGFENVITYINSGNIIFETKKILNTNKLERDLHNEFGFDIKVVAITIEEMQEALTKAPKWWGKDKDSKHNAIFVIEPFTAEQIVREIGDINNTYEQVEYYKKIIFWSAPVKTFSKTRWSKIVGTKAYKFITIRNYNTTMKMLEIINKFD